MPFPLTLAEHTWKDGPELLAAVLADAKAGGGQVVAGHGPSHWLGDLVDQGALEPELAVGLVAALLQQRGDAGAVSEAARLAVQLGRDELGELVVMSLDAFDTALLLTADPLHSGASVEDALLTAAVQLADLAIPEMRAQLLPRLRNAGLTGLECQLLAQHGDENEIRLWLPAVLTEGLPDGASGALVEGLARGGEETDALLDVLEEADPRVREMLWEAIARSDRRKQLQSVVTRLHMGAQGEA
ncbi:MAG: hypothetical protein JRI25_00165 [Deltaproteobacteria bacterium]|nr:hypothetical protein [Deltaproteobacteria bacterium]MBW2252991.1 hypothetical protein [Deltaproteobacteria bacterium]